MAATLSIVRRDVDVVSADAVLPGSLALPPDPIGVVVFAHGSGSSRLSPRNVQVAGVLNAAHLATLLFDLLTEEEARDRRNVFDIERLAGRLESGTAMLAADADTSHLPVGVFGASTGAAAALSAAASDPRIRAVVSRGGRPDLVGRRLTVVRAPTLLIVGGFDSVVLSLNERARGLLRCTCELRIVPGATHLFEEPGALEIVADLARRWFVEHLRT